MRAGLALPLSWMLGCVLAPQDTDTDESTGGDGDGTAATLPMVTTVGDDSSESTTGAGVTPAQSCVDYLQCLASVASPELAEAEAQYGAQGTCWADAAAAAPCAAECDAGLAGCEAADDSTGPSDPEYTCSLSMVAPGVASPVVTGAGEGELPVAIGLIVENYCGCHLVEDNDLLVPKTPEYNGPIRFSTWDQFQQPFGPSPTYREVERRAITQVSMPPVYHCDQLDFGSIGAEDYMVLAAWLAADAPDAASWP